jgi:dolichyl-phosphate-mannose--protein O-mannosyl transferase
VSRLRSHPLVLLALVVLLSLAARIAWLGAPCQSPCRSPADHTLIFDETYYVNAARVIAGVPLPAGARYAGTPAGDDPNSEHPQLVKLIIAGSIELFGDGPLAWRLGSIVFGTLAILGMFALVCAAGGGRWLALGASALMACDNLMLVQGRIGTLDVYVLAAMVWGVALYLRGRPLAAGITLGVGACMKLVAPYALLVLGLLELGRWLVAVRQRPMSWTPGRALARLGACVAATVGVFFALLDVLDRIAPPYDPNTHRLLTGGPLGHLTHMLSFAADLTSPHGPLGIASYPWQWIVDYKPIVYLNIEPAHPAAGLYGIHPAVHFLGVVSPPILLLALPALGLAGRSVWRVRAVESAPGERPASEVAIVSLAWFLGTFVPFELLSLLLSRTSYLYYMVIVMPGIYMAVALLISRHRQSRRRLIGVWIACVLIAAILMYPLTPLP